MFPIHGLFDQPRLVLVDRGIIIPSSMLWGWEGSSDAKEIWIVTPDLEPDLSDASVGKLVGRNLRSGKKYIYFYPDGILNIDEAKLRLFANFGLSRAPKIIDRITLVSISASNPANIFQRGNSLLIFKGDASEVTPLAFEEVVLTKVSRRGYFWQQHDVLVAQQLQKDLSQALRNNPP